MAYYNGSATYSQSGVWDNSSTDSFTYRVFNGQKYSEEATVTITINALSYTATGYEYPITWLGVDDGTSGDRIGSTVYGGNVALQIEPYLYNWMWLTQGIGYNSLGNPQDLIWNDETTETFYYTDNGSDVVASSFVEPVWSFSSTFGIVMLESNLTGYNSVERERNAGLVVDGMTITIDPSVSPDGIPIMDGAYDIRINFRSPNTTSNRMEVTVNGGDTYYIYCDDNSSNIQIIGTGTAGSPVRGNYLILENLTGTLTITSSSRFSALGNFALGVNEVPLITSINFVDKDIVIPNTSIDVVAIDKLLQVDKNSTANLIQVEAFNGSVDPITFSVESNPQNGVVSYTGSGVFEYTPTAGFKGTDTFTFRATDSGSTDVGTVTVRTVKPQPQLSSNPIHDSHKVYTCTENEDLTINVKNVNPHWIQIEQEGYETKYHDRGR